VYEHAAAHVGHVACAAVCAAMQAVAVVYVLYASCHICGRDKINEVYKDGTC
jgi:hypothetical protein